MAPLSGIVESHYNNRYVNTLSQLSDSVSIEIRD